MGLSDTENAHGELADEEYYDYVLCCNIPGATGDIECDGTNKIIGLSSPSNAHAEVPEGTIYSNDICYEDLGCTYSEDSCPQDTTEILSLSDLTNAHIGSPGDYDTKICCDTSSVKAGGCSLSSAQWEFIEAEENQKVRLYVTGSSDVDCNGLAVSFEVTEGGIFSQGSAETQPVSVAFNGDTATGVWYAEWVEDAGTNPEYYFTATIGDYEITSDDPKLVVIPQDVDFCSISLCGDYTTKDDCESDSCGIAESSGEGTVDCSEDGIYCECSWDDDAGTCDFGYTEILEDDCGDAETGCNFGCTLCYDSTEESNYCTLGSTCPTGYEPLSNNDEVCDFGEGCSSSDCGDGERDSCESPFYCLSGKCSSVEGPSTESGTCKVTQEITSECDEAPVGYKSLVITGTWTGEGECGTACENCNAMDDEEITVPCAAQIQLHFFGTYSIAITVALIVGIYAFLVFKEKNSKKKK